MVLTIELEQEADGRWIAEIPQLPGVLVYGESQDRAAQLVRALAFRVLADQIESGEVDAEICWGMSSDLLDNPGASPDANGVDRAQIREMLRLTPQARLLRVQDFVESVLEIRKLNETRSVR
jgi:predicted RNase H-like HicB family nuclease